MPKHHIFVLLALWAILATGTASTTAAPKVTVETSHEMILQVMDISSEKTPTDLYHYTCKAGAKRTEYVLCGAEDHIKYNKPHNVDLRLRCPKIGSTNRPIAGYRVDLLVTSPEVDCFQTDGGVGQRHVELLIKAKNTMSFDYSGSIYGR